jgi:diguanylate cyclase (GGDEF)-like protein
VGDANAVEAFRWRVGRNRKLAGVALHGNSIRLVQPVGITQVIFILDLIRAAVEARAMLPDRAVTVSIGVAAFSRDENWEAWMRRCDRKLYDAKAMGRNRIVA